MPGRLSRIVPTTLVVLAVVFIALLALSPILTPSAVSLPYKAGNVGSYATGSSSYVTFTLHRPAVLKGGFVTNASVAITIKQLDMPSALDQCKSISGFCYSSGTVSHGTLDVVLPAGTYRMTLSFNDDTVSQTWFNVTQSFVATYSK